MAVADVTISTVKPGRMTDALSGAAAFVSFYQERGAVATVSILYHAGSQALSMLSVIGHADLAAHGAFWEKCMAEPAWMEMRMEQDSAEAPATMGSFQLIRTMPGFDAATSGVGTTGWITQMDVAPGRGQDAMNAMLASKAKMAAHGLHYSATTVLAGGLDVPGTRFGSVISAPNLTAFGKGMEAAINDPAVLDGVSRLYGGAGAATTLLGRATFQRIL
jgi:hypothetical protein